MVPIMGFIYFTRTRIVIDIVTLLEHHQLYPLSFCGMKWWKALNFVVHD